MSLAAIRNTARTALHGFMSREASFYVDKDSDPASNVTITARRHDAPKMAGDLAGTNLSYAEVHERPTTLVLWASELTGLDLRRGNYILFTQTEGWFVETVMPTDNETITVEVTRLAEQDMTFKILPDGTIIGQR